MTIEFGDSRVPESFWEKVHIIPETDCWGWAGAIKKETSRGYTIAIIHAKRGKVTTLLLYMAEKFHEFDRETQKALRTCSDATCANPNHVRIYLKGQCVVDPEGHGVDRYPNGQCKACRKVKDKEIPSDVINERARNYRASLRSKGIRRSDTKKVKTVRERQKEAGLTVFGDRKPEKPWRPAGWSPEPKVNPWSSPRTHNEQERELGLSG